MALGFQRTVSASCEPFLPPRGLAFTIPEKERRFASRKAHANSDVGASLCASSAFALDKSRWVGMNDALEAFCELLGAFQNGLPKCIHGGVLVVENELLDNTGVQQGKSQ